MIREALSTFFREWPNDKAAAANAIKTNKQYNDRLKRGAFPGKTYPEDRKSFPLGELPSAKMLTDTIPQLLRTKCSLRDNAYLVKGSVGQGNPADVPWICVFDKDITTSAQTGYYLVYLFDAELGGVYLSLNQGWTQYERKYQVKEGKLQIRKNAEIAKTLLNSDQGFSYSPIDLHARGTLGIGYEAGNICSKFYPANAIPDDDVLVDDLRNAIGLYRELKGLVYSDIIDIESCLGEDAFQKSVQNGHRKEIPTGKVDRKNKKRGSSSVNAWPRDKDIAFTALENADFLCENDPGHTTFISGTTEQQFMEAHHLVPMEFQDEFEVSIDVPENVVSLCPNCHRAFHYSTPGEKKQLIDKFLDARRSALSTRGIEIDEKKLVRFYS